MRLMNACYALFYCRFVFSVHFKLLPEVAYERKAPVFARDCEVSYRDSDRPGAASLTVHEKGSLQGVKTVGFNITGN
jgi:hypothetical protein